jgi:tetratricopeptide (TPR) repeat protein
MDFSISLEHALHDLISGAPAMCVRKCNRILAENPGLIQALYLRGCASFELTDIAQSVADLQIVYDNHPEHLQAAYYLGRSLRAAGKFNEALGPLHAALGAEEFKIPARYELATCLARLRRRPEAIEHYQAILALQPDNAQVAANLASMLERENRMDEAETWADKALSLDSANETAQMTRATLDRRSEKYQQAALQFRRLIPQISNPVNRSIAWNQLGQCLEGEGDWDEAFNAFTESNEILRQHHDGSRPEPQSPHGIETLSRIQEWLIEKPMAAWHQPANDDAGGIVFLVGFPRSGTTLLDRMLRAHPDVEVLEEKSLFSLLHQDWSNPGTLEALADIDEAQIMDARAIYRQEMSRQRHQPQRSVVIDKLPLNLAYLFLIYRLFPAAPVIFLQRHPMDACISCFSQAFELEASMGYFLDIEQTAQYYDAVMQVAALSMDQVGNPIHQLRYEDLVAAPQAQLAALTDFLGLQRHDPMLEFGRQSEGETSNTPSYQQVSQPLHSRSIGKWRRYANRLESSQSVLQPWVDRFGYNETDNAESHD